MMCSGMPWISTVLRIASRVVPAWGVHDRNVVADELIEQARFADIRRADEYHVQPVGAGARPWRERVVSEATRSRSAPNLLAHPPRG